MKLMNTYLVASLRAALSLALLAGTGAVYAEPTEALIGGNLVSGDQATVALDATNPSAFSVSKPAVGPSTATAYFGSHIFCAELSPQPSQVSLLPRFQQTDANGDVWLFPSVFLHSFKYEGSGYQNGGVPTLYLGQASNLASSGIRCLSSIPGPSTEFPNVSQGLLDSGFGGDVPPTPPSGPHQNIVVSGESFAGYPGKSVSVITVTMQFDPGQPAAAVWTLIDGFNDRALIGTGANWCLLRTDWIAGSAPPAGLCDDPSIIIPGFHKETGPFVQRTLGFPAGNPGPYHVLVYRDAVGFATAGTPKQGFAAIRTSGGMALAPEEMQDWYSDDSVWYAY